MCHEGARIPLAWETASCVMRSVAAETRTRGTGDESTLLRRVGDK